MKLKHIVAVAAALSAGGAFAAATPIACPASPNLTQMLNSCAPEVTFYVAGASAQAGALQTILENGTVFDNSKVRGRIALSDPAQVAGLNGVVTTDYQGKTNTKGWIGYGAPGTPYATKRVLVIYNKANGSAAGVNQLLTGKGLGTAGTTADESITLVTSTVKNLAKGISGTCVVDTDSASGSLGLAHCDTSAAFKSAWGVDAQKAPQMALSDVRPNELSPDIGTAGKALFAWKAASFPAVQTGLQGFGVIVNSNLYQALIAKEVALGRLPSSCSTGEVTGGATDTITAACQPNLSRADYASVILGKANASDLLGSTQTQTLTLARRVDSSGTQASSNIFFAGQAGYIAKTPATDGFADLATTAAKGKLDAVIMGAGTGDVITAVSGNTTDFAIGVVSLENTYSMTKSASKLKGALFVKVEGISPNFKADGSLDAKHRAGLQNGYTFGYEMQALKPTALAGDYLDIYNKIVAGLTNPANDLAGIAYIGSADATKNTAYTHNGNNYLPLAKY